MAYIQVDGVGRSSQTMNILASDVQKHLRRTIRVDVDGAFFYTEQRGVDGDVMMIPVKADKIDAMTQWWNDVARLKSIIVGAADIVRYEASPWVDMEAQNG